MLYDEILKSEEETKKNYLTMKSPEIDPPVTQTPWKYNEEEIVKELLEYIRGTYKKHYAANDQNL